MDTSPLSTLQVDYSGGGVAVKGEEKAYGIFFEPEEKLVEKQVKRELTKTPEEFVSSEQDSKQEERVKALSRYHTKRALLQKQGHKQHNLYRCLGCFERKKLGLYKAEATADYILLCDRCIKKKREEKKKTKLWSRGPGINGGSPESKKTAFLISIRALVFERDGAECPYCGSKENLGLAALMPLSRGGKLCFDNYAVSCQKCRGARSGSKYSKPMTPLEYFWQKEGLKSYLSECLDNEPTATAGATDRINLHLKAELIRYLHKQAAGEEVERSKAELLAIRLSDTDGDKRREREQLPW